MTKDQKILSLMDAMDSIVANAEWNAKTADGVDQYNEFMAIVHIAEETQARVRGE